jgi:DMSO reductase family type II enzyme heme b subunit
MKLTKLMSLVGTAPRAIRFGKTTRRARRSRPTLLLVAVLLAGCQKAPPPPVTEVILTATASLPAEPNHAAWQNAPEYAAKLLLQDMVEPRQLKPTTAEVRVRALQNGKEVAFRLEWADATQNNTPGPAKFSDGCAVQFPAKADPTVPAPQMGEPGKPVEITFWTANWQAIVDGRPDNLKALYPTAQIDHYPSEAAKDADTQKEMAARYSPARALGNTRGGPRTVPVEDYIAEGPGTLTAVANSTSTGKAQRTATGWAVVITRSLPAGRQVAFAVWDGAQEEVGARKMRTGWIPMKQP